VQNIKQENQHNSLNLKKLKEQHPKKEKKNLLCVFTQIRICQRNGVPYSWDFLLYR